MAADCVNCYLELTRLCCVFIVSYNCESFYFDSSHFISGHVGLLMIAFGIHAHRRHGGPRIAGLYDGTKSEILLSLWAGRPHRTFQLCVYRWCCDSQHHVYFKSRVIAPRLRALPADSAAGAEAAVRGQNAIVVVRLATLRVRAPRRLAVDLVGMAVVPVEEAEVEDTVVSAAAVTKRRGA